LRQQEALTVLDALKQQLASDPNARLDLDWRLYTRDGEVA
jgi:hypothetical protein